MHLAECSDVCAVTMVAFSKMVVLGLTASASGFVVPTAPRPMLRGAHVAMVAENVGSTGTPLESNTPAVAGASLEEEFESVKAASQVASAIAEVMPDTASPASKKLRKRDRVLGVWRGAKAAAGLGGALKEAAEELIEDSCDIDEPEVCTDPGRFQAATRELGALIGKTLRFSRGKATEEELAADDSMEAGWAQRGQGSAFKRTTEVWGFLAKCGLRVVKARKSKGTPEEVSRSTHAAAAPAAGALHAAVLFTPLRTSHPSVLFTPLRSLPLAAGERGQDGRGGVHPRRPLHTRPDLRQARPSHFDSDRRTREGVHRRAQGPAGQRARLRRRPGGGDHREGAGQADRRALRFVREGAHRRRLPRAGRHTHMHMHMHMPRAGRPRHAHAHASGR